MLGENVLQTLQRILTVTHQLQELAKEVNDLKPDVNARLEKNDDRFCAFDDHLRVLEVAVGRLEESRATQRETVRAEIATAVAELRVRFAEEQRQRGQEPPALSGKE